MFNMLPAEGYSPHIGVLISNYEYIRRNTLFLAKNLSVEQFDYNIDLFSNSIGTLLLHIAALESDFLVKQILKRKPTRLETKKYENAIGPNMEKRLVKGKDINFYVNELTNNRNIIFEKLKNYDDNWLFSDISIGENKLANNYFFLRHILDDEISHQGQIKMIRKRLDANS